MQLRDLRIGPRLGLGFGAILLALVATVATVVYSGQQQRQALAQGLQRSAEQQALAASMRDALLSSAVAMRNMGLQTTVEAVQNDEAEARNHRKTYLSTRKSLEDSGLEPTERDTLARLAAIDKQMEEHFADAVGLASQFNTEQAAKVITQKIDPLLKKAGSELNAFVQAQVAKAAATAAQAQADERTTTAAVSVTGALVVALAALLSWRITLSVTRPMRAALEATVRVERGDLASVIESTGADEAAGLLKGLAQMRDGLSRIVSEVRSGADNISSGARDIASANADLSHRTEAQAANLEQTAASIE